MNRFRLTAIFFYSLLKVSLVLEEAHHHHHLECINVLLHLNKFFCFSNEKKVLHSYFLSHFFLYFSQVKGSIFFLSTYSTCSIINFTYPFAIKKIHTHVQMQKNGKLNKKQIYIINTKWKRVFYLNDGKNGFECEEELFLCRKMGKYS